MSIINTNINALFAQNALTVNSRSENKAMQQLSTGSQINSASDNAAGLAIGQSMTAQIRGLNQGVKNANDAISMLQTADGSMATQTDMLQRMRELAVQAGTATYSSTQQGYMDKEFQALSSQISSIAANTKWNGMNILYTTASGGASYSFAVGANGTTAETISVTLASTDTNTGLGISSLSVSSVSLATSAISTIDTALNSINSARAALGAGINRLTYAADNLTNISQNTTASRSSIQDTDYATATSNLARSQIIQQAATAMLAQANQQPQSVLALLK